MTRVTGMFVLLVALVTVPPATAPSRPASRNSSDSTNYSSQRASPFKSECSLTSTDLSFLNAELGRVVEPAAFLVTVGAEEAGFTYRRQTASGRAEGSDVARIVG